MKPEPLTIAINDGITLVLSCAGDDIVGTLRHGGKDIAPTARATANSDAVRTQAGALHLSRTQFYIPAEHRRAVVDFIKAARAA